MALTPEQREYQREYKRKKRAEDPEQRLKDAAGARRYRVRNRDTIIERERVYRNVNRAELAAKRSKYYAENGDKVRKQSSEAYRRNPAAAAARFKVYELRRRHGIQPETWARMWAAQDGCCYLCGGQLGDRVAVDHDHSHCPAGRSCSACRRGLAHPECNSAIGFAKDDPDQLRRMADALELAKQGVTQRIALTGEQLSLYEGVI